MSVTAKSRLSKETLRNWRDGSREGGEMSKRDCERNIARMREQNRSTGRERELGRLHTEESETQRWTEGQSYGGREGYQELWLLHKNESIYNLSIPDLMSVDPSLHSSRSVAYWSRIILTLLAVCTSGIYNRGHYSVVWDTLVDAVSIGFCTG